MYDADKFMHVNKIVMFLTFSVPFFVFRHPLCWNVRKTQAKCAIS